MPATKNVLVTIKHPVAKVTITVRHEDGETFPFAIYVGRNRVNARVTFTSALKYAASSECLQDYDYNCRLVGKPGLTSEQKYGE
jgi:hypothetical protein